MIKIPATEEGLPAITAATAAGISVNVTLIFGLDRYDAVMDAYLDRPRAGQGRRHRPVDDPLGRVVLRLPRRHRDRQAARQDRHRRGEGAARQGRASPTPGWPTSATRRSSPPTAGRRSPTPAPTCSARCGPRPASRTRPTTTRCTSSSWSPRTPSTRCPRPPSTRWPTTAQIRGDAIAGTYDDARKVHRRPRRGSASSYDDVIEVLEAEGVQKFEDSYDAARRERAGPARRRRQVTRAGPDTATARRERSDGEHRHRGTATESQAEADGPDVPEAGRGERAADGPAADAGTPARRPAAGAHGRVRRRRHATRCATRPTAGCRGCPSRARSSSSASAATCRARS